MSCSSFEIRRAKVSEMGGILDLLAECFTPEGATRPTTGPRVFPYLFCDNRIPNHFVCVDGGRIVGAVALYPYDVRIGGVEFKAGGVGQVSCRKVYRGRGVMTSILRRIIEESETMGLDFAWLWGDRQRYGRYGWINGGRTMHFNTFARYLDAPTRTGDIQHIHPTEDLNRVHRAVLASDDAVLMSRRELGLLLRAQGVGGLKLNRSFILTRARGQQVCFGHGNPDELASLLASQLLRVRKAGKGNWSIHMECGTAPTPFQQVCLQYYHQMHVSPCASFRVVSLVPFLEKVCRVVQPGIADGDDTVSLVSSDTGEAATVRCRKGRLSVTEGRTRSACLLSPAELSELCFGMSPPDLFFPRLSPASPLRRVFPFPAYISHLFSV